MATFLVSRSASRVLRLLLCHLPGHPCHSVRRVNWLSYISRRWRRMFSSNCEQPCGLWSRHVAAGSALESGNQSQIDGKGFRNKLQEHKLLYSVDLMAEFKHTNQPKRSVKYLGFQSFFRSRHVILQSLLVLLPCLFFNPPDPLSNF